MDHKGESLAWRKHLLVPFYYIGAGTILQGLSPVLTKLLLDALTPAAVVSTRYLIAVIFLLPFGWRHTMEPQLQPPRKRDWLALFLVGALGSGVASLLFTYAIHLTSAGIATALSKTAPLFVAFFAYFTLKERVTSARVLLVGLMAAADMLIGAGELHTDADVRQRLWGDALALGAGTLRALAEILSKASLRRFYPASIALWRFGIGCVVIGTMALIKGDWRGLWLLNVREWLLLFSLGGLCTSLSMGLYYRGLRDVPAHVGASLRLLSAMVTVIVSWIVLGEKLNAWHLSGILILLSGAYLLVVRSTRHPVPHSALAPAEGAGRLPLTQTMRGRIALLISSLIALSILITTGLSVQHTWTVLNEQVRLTMIKTATIVLQLQGVAFPPQPETYRQYLDRIIHHRLAGQFYSVEVMYLIVLDGKNNIIAFAIRDDLDVRDAMGRPLASKSRAAAERLLELSAQQKVSALYDMVPVAAELQQRGRITGVVHMGCRRSLALRPAVEIAFRNLSLAIILIVLGVSLAYRLTEFLTRPLEEFSRTVHRIAHGELEVPLLPKGSHELTSLGQSVTQMAEKLRQERLLREALMQWSGCIPPNIASRPVCLLIRFQSVPPETAEGQWQALLTALSHNEGHLAAIAPGYVLAVFGGAEPEQDDVLRAVLAALQWRRGLAQRNLPLPNAILVDRAENAIENPWAHLHALAALLPAKVDEHAPVYVTQRAAQAVTEHFELVFQPDHHLWLVHIDVIAEQIFEAEGTADL